MQHSNPLRRCRRLLLAPRGTPWLPPTSQTLKALRPRPPLLAIHQRPLPVPAAHTALLGRPLRRKAPTRTYQGRPVPWLTSIPASTRCTALLMARTVTYITSTVDPVPRSSPDSAESLHSHLLAKSTKRTRKMLCPPTGPSAPATPYLLSRTRNPSTVPPLRQPLVTLPPCPPPTMHRLHSPRRSGQSQIICPTQPQRRSLAWRRLHVHRPSLRLRCIGSTSLLKRYHGLRPLTRQESHP